MQLKHLKIPFFFAFAKIIFHLFTNTIWGFHRDELLYLALGRHPDWGFWSNPPLTGWLSWLMQNTLGDGQAAVRLIPALFSAATPFYIDS
jgi:hypothetical protein